MNSHHLPLQRHPIPTRGPNAPMVPNDDAEASLGPVLDNPGLILNPGLLVDESTDNTSPDSAPSNYFEAEKSSTNNSNESGPDTMGSTSSRPGAYQPSALDVLVCKAMVAKGLSIPLEMVDRIMDFAEYWPHTTSSVVQPTLGRMFSHGRGRGEDIFLLRTPPLGFLRVPHVDPERYTREPAKILRMSDEHPLEQFQKWIGSEVPPVRHPCRKIVFTIRSRDQGWGGDPKDRGTYKGSWTWFEAGVERVDARGDCGDDCPDAKEGQPAATASSSKPSTVPQISPCAMRSIRPAVLGEDQSHTRFDFPLLPAADKVQCNKTASSEYVTHVVEWRATDDIHLDSHEAEKLEGIGRGKASGNGEFVRNLKLGDVVTLWSKQRFGGWANHVESAQVDVYWSI